MRGGASRKTVPQDAQILTIIGRGRPKAVVDLWDIWIPFRLRHVVVVVVNVLSFVIYLLIVGLCLLIPQQSAEEEQR